MATCKLCLNSEAALGLSISNDPSNSSLPEQQRHQLVDPSSPGLGRVQDSLCAGSEGGMAENNREPEEHSCVVVPFTATVCFHFSHFHFVNHK